MVQATWFVDHIDKDLYWKSHMQFHGRERVTKKEIIEIINDLINGLYFLSYSDMALARGLNFDGNLHEQLNSVCGKCFY